MPKFQVEVQEVHTQLITVEALDAEAARLAANEVLESGVNQDGTDLPEDITYDHTIECAEWKVWSA